MNGPADRLQVLLGILKRTGTSPRLGVPEAEHRARHAMTFSMTTRSPSKYRLVDLETGDIWQPEGAGWRRAEWND